MPGERDDEDRRERKRAQEPERRPSRDRARARRAARRSGRRPPGRRSGRPGTAIRAATAARRSGVAGHGGRGAGVREQLRRAGRRRRRHRARLRLGALRLERLAHPPQPAVQPRLRGPGRDPERGGRLALGQAEQVAQRDDPPLVLAERRQRRSDLGVRLPADDLELRGAGDRDVARALVRGGAGRRSPDRGDGAVREPLAPSAGPDAVPCLVAHDREQPGPERRTGPEPVQREVRLHEPLLGGVLGVGARCR